MYKNNVDLAAAAEKAMKAKGVVLNGRKTQNEFYQENPAVFESVKASGSGCSVCSHKFSEKKMLISVNY